MQPPRDLSADQGDRALLAPAAEHPQLTAAAVADATWREDVLPLMDHELRTPLTVATGWCESLLDGDLGPLTPDQRQAVLRIALAASAVVDAIVLSEVSVASGLVSGVAQACGACPLRS